MEERQGPIYLGVDLRLLGGRPHKIYRHTHISIFKGYQNEVSYPTFHK